MLGRPVNCPYGAHRRDQAGGKRTEHVLLLSMRMYKIDVPPPHQLEQPQHDHWSGQAALVDDSDGHAQVTKRARELSLVEHDHVLLDVIASPLCGDEAVHLRLGAGPQVSGDDMQDTHGRDLAQLDGHRVPLPDSIVDTAV